MQEISLPYFSNIEQLPDSVIDYYMRQYDYGYFREFAYLFQELFERCDLSQICWEKRVSSITQYDWTILSKTGSDKQIDTLKNWLQGIHFKTIFDDVYSQNYTGFIKRILTARLYGYSVFKIDSVTSEGIWLSYIPAWLIRKKNNRYYFAKDDLQQKLESVDNLTHLIVLGGVLIKSLVKLIKRRLRIWQCWMSYAEKYLKPSVAVYSEAEYATERFTYLQNEAAKFAEGDEIILADDEKIENVPRILSGTDPYKTISEQLEIALTIAWRGSNLSTKSQVNAVGASLQSHELSLLEMDDCEYVSEIYNRLILPLAFNVLKIAEGSLIFKIQDQSNIRTADELKVDEFLYNSGVQQSLSDLLLRYSRSKPDNPEDIFGKLPEKTEEK